MITILKSSLETYTKKRRELISEIDFLKNQIKNFEKKEIKELKDVEKLEGNGLLSSFYKFIGFHEGILSKEQEEYFKAKQVLEKSKFELEDKFYSLNNIDIKIKELNDEISKSQDIINSKINYFESLDNFSSVKQEYLRLKSNVESISKIIVELEEAKAACNNALKETLAAITHLSNADGWALVDIIGGGLLSDLMKYDEIDKSQTQLNSVSIALNKLKKELDDVNETIELPHLGIDKSTQFFDVWFDNIFSDFQVKDQIRNQQTELDTLKSKLKTILDVLNTNSYNSQIQLNDFKIEFDRFLMKDIE
jgi:hypothetical protein